MHGSREAGSQRRADSREEIGYLVMPPASLTILGHRIILMSIQRRAPNMRLKLTARVDCGMNLSSARRSLSAIR